MEKDNLKSVLLKNFRSYADAEMAKELLEKQGIKCGIQRGNANAFNDFTAYTGDADMFVLEDRLEEAKKIIKDYFKE